MLELISILMLALTLSTALMVVAGAVSLKSFSDEEKKSPFECGFTPKFSSRLNFSLQFFLVALIFLIFDVELILLFPCLPIYYLGGSFYEIMILLIFICVLTFGLVVEWSCKMLEWYN